MTTGPKLVTRIDFNSSGFEFMVMLINSEVTHLTFKRLATKSDPDPVVHDPIHPPSRSNPGLDFFSSSDDFDIATELSH